MNADERRKKLDGITEKVIGCIYKVSNTLGSGFLEKVYENALAIEIRKSGLTTQQQYSIQVKYDDAIVGEFAADLLVEEKVIIELKATKALDDVHVAQCLNYLKATDLAVCLLVNFGKPRAEIRRIVNNY
jgi:GxxExxY protein